MSIREVGRKVKTQSYHVELQLDVKLVLDIAYLRLLWFQSLFCTKQVFPLLETKVQILRCFVVEDYQDIWPEA